MGGSSIWTHYDCPGLRIAMKPRQQRPFLRYSIASLLLVVTVLGIWLGWLVNSATRQRDAVHALRTVGCDITYSSNSSEVGIAGGIADAEFIPTSTWRSRLADTLGVDLFQKVVGLNLYDVVTDDDLEVLRNLRAVESLDLGPKVSDVGLRYVGQLRGCLQSRNCMRK